MSGGIRFQCQRCGRCCRTRGEAGFVYLTREDQGRLAAFLGLTPGELSRDWTERLGERVVLRDAPGSDGACILLEGKRCRAWAARPLQCRTWPFWPEHLPEGAFEREVASFCPGAGKGRRWDEATIRVIAETLRKADFTG